MKKTYLFFLLMLSIMLAVSCSDEWNKHYEGQSDEDISPLTLNEYFESEDGYDKFFDLLKSTGLDNELSKDQYLTIWAVKDVNYDISTIGSVSDSLLAGYHLNYLAFGASDLKDGLRVQCLNGIYLTISSKTDGFYANYAKIISSKRFKNGVVHEIDGLMAPKTNMFDFVQNLSDDYSIIRDSILHYNKRIFDKTNSSPIGVDQTGNTVYDSVFYTSNPLFEKADFSSEFKQFTMFLPSNNVIKDCFQSLHSQYKMMGKVFSGADTVLVMTWIKEAMFHNGVISDYGSTQDLTSPFDRVWRTTIQEVDKTDIKELSNGIVYNITKLKVPNNIIITRIKSLAHYYEYLTDALKTELYTFNNCKTIGILKGDETPIKGDYYYLLEVGGDITTTDEFSVEFTPLDYNAVNGTASTLKVPPGEYNLYMGFRSSNHPIVDVYFQGGESPLPFDMKPVAVGIEANSSTPWNYDRTNETDPNISKWNGLGGLVGVVNISGTEMSTFRVKVKFNRLSTADGAKKMQIYHWSLKPTLNNY